MGEETEQRRMAYQREMGNKLVRRLTENKALEENGGEKCEDKEKHDALWCAWFQESQTGSRACQTGRPAQDTQLQGKQGFLQLELSHQEDKGIDAVNTKKHTHRHTHTLTHTDTHRFQGSHSGPDEKCHDFFFL